MVIITESDMINSMAATLGTIVPISLFLKTKYDHD
jgi:hypothetical protein